MPVLRAGPSRTPRWQGFVQSKLLLCWLPLNISSTESHLAVRFLLFLYIIEETKDLEPCAPQLYTVLDNSMLFKHLAVVAMATTSALAAAIGSDKSPVPRSDLESRARVRMDGLMSPVQSC